MSPGHELAGRRSVTAGELEREAALPVRMPDGLLDTIVDSVALGRLVVMAGESVAGPTQAS